MKKLSEEIIEFRHRRNKTKKEFALEAHISKPTLAKIEKGYRPSPNTYMLIASYMGKSVTRLTSLETKGGK